MIKKDTVFCYIQCYHLPILLVYLNMKFSEWRGKQDCCGMVVGVRFEYFRNGWSHTHQTLQFTQNDKEEKSIQWLANTLYVDDDSVCTILYNEKSEQKKHLKTHSMPNLEVDVLQQLKTTLWSNSVCQEWASEDMVSTQLWVYACTVLKHQSTDWYTVLRTYINIFQAPAHRVHSAVTAHLYCI